MNKRSNILLTATGSNDAINDILNNGRYEGAMSSIAGLTAVFDTFSVAFISFVAFMIISVAIWRNVLAGAYAAFPKFFDQVHEAHTEVADVSFYSRITGIKQSLQNASMSSIKKFIMQFIPDVKSLTDFEDETIEPKTYFTKALLQMILVVMVGIFIYNGYYRDTTVVVAKFASTIFERTLLNVDPIEIYDRILATSGTPDFSTDNAQDTKNKRINKLSKAAYKAIVSKYTDIQTADQKAKLASAIENAIMAWADDKMSDQISKDSWKMSYDFMLTIQPTGMQDNDGDNGNSVSRVFSTPVSSFGFESTMYTGENWYLTGVATFNKTTIKDKALTYTDVVMKATAKADTGAKTWTFDVNDDAKLRVYGTGTLSIKNTTYTFKVDNNVWTFTDKMPSGGTQGTASVVGLHYVVDGQDNTLTSVDISVGAAGKPTFSSKEANNSVGWGEKMTYVEAEDTESTETKSSETKSK